MLLPSMNCWCLERQAMDFHDSISAELFCTGSTCTYTLVLCTGSTCTYTLVLCTGSRMSEFSWIADDWCYEHESPEFIWIANGMNMNWLPWLRFSWIAMPYPNSAESTMEGTSSTPIQLNRWRLPPWGLPQRIQLNRGSPMEGTPIDLLDSNSAESVRTPTTNSAESPVEGTPIDLLDSNSAESVRTPLTVETSRDYHKSYCCCQHATHQAKFVDT